MRAAFLIFISFWLAVCAPAAGDPIPGRWDFAGWYGGGCYPNVEFDPNVKGRVYLASDVAGIWRSDDSGDHWRFITQGLGNLIVAQVAVAPSDSNVLYAATGGGVFVSIDAGASWKATDTVEKKIAFVRPANYRALAVHPRSADRLCAGTSKGRVFCSRNSGASWRDVDVPREIFSDDQPVAALAFDGEGKTFWAASARGIIRCGFEGGDCRRLRGGPAKAVDLVVSKKIPGTIYAVGENRIWTSSDTGLTWSQGGPAKDGIYRVALDESSDKSPGIYLIWNSGWQGGVMKSLDAGAAWEPRDQDLQADLASNPTRAWAGKGGKSTALKVDPFDPDVVFRTDWWGVWRSDDGGKTWVEKIAGAPNSVGSDIVVSSDGKIFVATMDNGLLRSSDAGKSYQALFPKSGYKKDSNGHVWRVAVDGRRVVATSSPWGEPVNQVIVSQDGGQTFQLVRDGLPGKRPKVNTMWGEGYPRALAVDPVDPNQIYLGIDGDDGGGLFISSDGGLSWTRSAGQPGALRIYNGLVVDVKDPDVIFWAACGDKGGVYKSTDRGQSWTRVFSESSWVFDLHMSSDGVLYAAGSSTYPVVYVSKDQGASWKNMALPVEGSSAADAVITASGNPGLVAVSTVSWGGGAPQKIYLSRDAGKTWADISGGLPPGAGAAAMAFSPDGKKLFMTRYAGSVYVFSLAL
jgi:photosystem II stability/assembly factor-like uncharacterized protein